MEAKNLDQSFLKINEYWSPRVISSVEDFYVKIAKILGEFPLHVHENEDELFMVHRGSMILEVEGESVVLQPGDVFLVEKGKKHRPIAADVCEIILIEKKSTAHTGDVESDHSKSIEDQLKPL